jgi:hypothetical protein
LHSCSLGASQAVMWCYSTILGYVALRSLQL